MNYTEYVATYAEIAAIEARNRQDEMEFHGRVLHDLLELGREVVNVQRQKAFIQAMHLARDPRDIELRHHKDLSIPFDRLARGIRMAILLHQKVIDLAKTPPPAPSTDPAAAEPPEPPPEAQDRLEDVSPLPPGQTIAEIIDKARQEIAAAGHWEESGSLTSTPNDPPPTHPPAPPAPGSARPAPYDQPPRSPVR